MKRILAIFTFIIIYSPLFADVTPSTNYRCSNETVRVEIRRESSNLMFLTTGLTTAATAQYYITSCISTVTTSGKNGLFSIVMAPQLRENIAQGEGKYVRAWLQLINIPEKKHGATISLLKEKYPNLNSKDDLRFVQQIHEIAYDFNDTPFNERIIILKQS